MTRPAVHDERQDFLFDDAPEIRVWRNDEKALAAMREIVEQLEASATHPWSARLLGWQVRTFETNAHKVLPIEAEALRVRLNLALERLGPPED